MLVKIIANAIFARLSSSCRGVSHTFELDPYKNWVGGLSRNFDCRFTIEETEVQKGKVSPRLHNRDALNPVLYPLFLLLIPNESA